MDRKPRRCRWGTRGQQLQARRWRTGEFSWESPCKIGGPLVAPAMGREDVDAFAGEMVRPGFVGGDADGGTAEGLADLEVVNGCRSTAMIGLHAKHHGY